MSQENSYIFEIAGTSMGSPLYNTEGEIRLFCESSYRHFAGKEVYECKMGRNSIHRHFSGRKVFKWNFIDIFFSGTGVEGGKPISRR